MSVTSDSILLTKGLSPYTQSRWDRSRIGMETLSALLSLT